MVGQVLRFYPVHELGRQLVDDGEIGEITYIETDYSGPYNAPRNRPDSWYGTVGGLLENGIHKSESNQLVRRKSSDCGSRSGEFFWTRRLGGLYCFLDTL